jgi:heme oxygenase (mycobilin-producing)
VIVVSNRIPLVAGNEAALLERLADRVGLVERHPGFVRLEVLQPAPGILSGQETERADSYLVLTYWARPEDFVAWTQSEDFRRAHGQRTAADSLAGPPTFEVHRLVQTTEGGTHA